MLRPSSRLVRATVLSLAAVVGVGAAAEAVAGHGKRRRKRRHNVQVQQAPVSGTTQPQPALSLGLAPLPTGFAQTAAPLPAAPLPAAPLPAAPKPGLNLTNLLSGLVGAFLGSPALAPTATGGSGGLGGLLGSAASGTPNLGSLIGALTGLPAPTGSAPAGTTPAGTTPAAATPASTGSSVAGTVASAFQSLVSRLFGGTFNGASAPNGVGGTTGGSGVGGSGSSPVGGSGGTSSGGSSSPGGSLPTGTNPGSTSGAFIQLPATGTGFYAYSLASNRWGTQAMIYGIQRVGNGIASSIPDGPRLGIGDISKQGGGPFPPHKSHQKGMDADIRPMRVDRNASAVSYGDAAYSRARTQIALNLFRQNMSVQLIFFNDPQTTGTRPLSGHSNHFHVRINQSSGGSAAASGGSSPAQTASADDNAEELNETG